MAAERIITCLSILLLFAALISIAQAIQDGIPDSNHMTVPTRKGLLKGGNEHAASVTAAINKKWLRGRKMVQMKKLNDVENMSGAFGLGGSTSKLSKCGNNNNNNNKGCDQITVNLPDEVDEHRSGFVAFNADYHTPRHHPPKNN
ncbi:hypothetical protein ERO13_A13G088845v2 [Gossypium hirsutum]|uniref:Uncharacterized protein n=2 Tax=Gossypium TaxID=3633 RepID=A0A1U8IBG0_GOSHI|nr:uncharacterized protein LOC107894711 [Gossypium hirsutum]KAG4165761.1 hypothetical protein ERO13_A13G088845v2 [Gossypium hirsutum]TYH91405.1 hypothetical protein ES332_A13G113300v1 [Gossypium tomentosum]